MKVPDRRVGSCSDLGFRDSLTGRGKGSAQEDMLFACFRGGELAFEQGGAPQSRASARAHGVPGDTKCLPAAIPILHCGVAAPMGWLARAPEHVPWRCLWNCARQRQKMGLSQSPLPLGFWF